MDRIFSPVCADCEKLRNEVSAMKAAGEHTVGDIWSVSSIHTDTWNPDSPRIAVEIDQKRVDIIDASGKKTGYTKKDTQRRVFTLLYIHEWIVIRLVDLD